MISGGGVNSTEILSGVQVRSLPAAVAERLREAILAGVLKPGERLIEQKLAGRFGIGQPTLREALKELDLQGFVRKTAPNKGTYVTRLNQEDFRKILEVRMALEVVAIGKAANHWNGRISHELGSIVARMEAAAREFDLATFHKNDLQFHRTIWDLTGNEYLSIALERVAFRLFAFVLLQRPGGAENEFLAAVEQHRQILAGLQSGDPNTARKAFLESTLTFWSEKHHVKVEVSDELSKSAVAAV
jgi:DNA-binding GntR family transcriptional regulator